MYAHSTNGTIDIIGPLPKGADADGQWLTLTPENAHLAGWFPVTDTPRPADTATHTHDRSVALDGTTPTVVWTQREWIAAELAARQATANDTTIRTTAATALAANRTFLALASPTQAQVLAQVRALTRQMNRLARLTLGVLDGTD